MFSNLSYLGSASFSHFMFYHFSECHTCWPFSRNLVAFFSVYSLLFWFQSSTFFFFVMLGRVLLRICPPSPSTSCLTGLCFDLLHMIIITIDFSFFLFIFSVAYWFLQTCHWTHLILKSSWKKVCHFMLNFLSKCYLSLKEVYF